MKRRGGEPRVGSLDLQQDIDELEALKIELEACETKEEVLEVAKKARYLWIDIKEDTRYSIGFIAHHQLGSRIDQMETFSTAMDARIMPSRVGTRTFLTLECVFLDLTTTSNLHVMSTTKV